MADPKLAQQDAIRAGGSDAVSVRGPLRYEIETSSPMVEAGRPFTVFLRVTNPYEVAVTISEVAFLFPVEFQDETRGRGDDRLVWRNQFSGARTPPPGLPGIAVAVTSRTGGLGGSRQTPDARQATQSVEAVGKVGQGQPESRATTIQPGDTFVHKVSLRSRRWLFFSPAVYNVEAQVAYKLDNQDHNDSVKVPLSLKTPMMSLIVGAVVGSLAGSVVRAASPSSSTVDLLQMLTQILLSAIVSAMVIVAFARKKDAQPFISVEDFFGGLFVGFAVGVASQSWVDWLTIPAPSN